MKNSFLIFSAISLMAFTAHSETIHWGEALSVGQGAAKTYAVENDLGTITELGIALDAGSLQGLPDGMPEYDYILPLPVDVSLPPFKHVMLNWNPHGHDPVVIYGAPHFDFHFYTISNDDRMKITCTGDDEAICMKPLEADHIPAYYAPTDFGVPMMGWHWFDTRSPEFHGQPFTTTILYGFYNAKMAFIEPMITLDFLKSHTQINAEVPVPEKVDEVGSYPSHYKIEYDSTLDLIKISITDFVTK